MCNEKSFLKFVNRNLRLNIIFYQKFGQKIGQMSKELSFKANPTEAPAGGHIFHSSTPTTSFNATAYDQCN